MSGPLAAMERLERLLAALERVMAPGSEARAALVARLRHTTGLSPANIEWALAHCLERTPSPAERMQLIGSVARAPRAHVILPGSVFVAPHRALALALAATPRVFVKPSRRDPALIEALHQQDPELFQLVQRIEPQAGDHVFAYGSDVTLDVLRRELPPGSVLHAHGSGFGVAVVELDAGEAELASAARAIAEDTACFDQRGCLSPRFVLARGASAAVEPFARRLAEALGELEQRLPLGRLEPSERAEGAWYRQCAAYAGALLSAGSGAVSLRASSEAPELVAEDGALALEVPPSGRYLELIPIVRLEVAIRALRPWITCVGCANARLESLILPWLDPVRVTRVGQMQRPPFDGPVDRRPSP
ncbi:MAG TPA: acyl-CoA reductase, partial [Polyangiaceae bacterium]|nr:acyl-CoA reductase [Polyangiaceae bacterium]